MLFSGLNHFATSFLSSFGLVYLLSHYSKSPIFVQKVDFDNTYFEFFESWKIWHAQIKIPGKNGGSRVRNLI